MRFLIMHQTKGMLRLRADQYRMSEEQADLLAEYICRIPGVERVTVHERTCGVVLYYRDHRQEILQKLSSFSYETAAEELQILSHTSRALSREYKEKIISHVIWHGLRRLYLPAPIRHGYILLKSIPYVVKAVKCLLRGTVTVDLLDGTAIAVSMLTGDFETAGSVMFLLKLGDYLDEWTRKKSMDDLARSMSLQIHQVWQRLPNGQEVLTPIGQIEKGAVVIVDAGNLIPLDGEIIEGEAMVNQASLTGESVPVEKRPGSTVFAGTVLEEGHCAIRVTGSSGCNKYDQIVRMIEESEKLSSQTETKAYRLADKLVPWCLGGSALTWLLTGNVTRAVSVLMVDFSCALKLAMPLSVLSAMREASGCHITVKGGKYMEKISQATTVIFDKTGTLTRSCPTVAEVVPFGGNDPVEMLRVAACLEEHFPHSMANAVVRAAEERGILHDEMHSQVEYIVAHGIASKIGQNRVVIGSHHFVFEDEAVTILPEDMPAFYALPERYSLLYLAIGGVLSAAICISDPLRPEAADVIRMLHQAGFQRTVMLTGDSDRTARAIAQEVGVDDYHAEVLPEEKAQYIQEEQAKGNLVIMIGDGINDAPALSYADVGIAIGSGAAIAREVADVTISAENLRELVYLRKLSDRLMDRIHRNYRFVMGFNGALILLGALGILAPAASAVLHNGSTLLLSMHSMTKLLSDVDSP